MTEKTTFVFSRVLKLLFSMGWKFAPKISLEQRQIFIEFQNVRRRIIQSVYLYPGVSTELDTGEYFSGVLNLLVDFMIQWLGFVYRVGEIAR